MKPRLESPRLPRRRPLPLAAPALAAPALAAGAAAPAPRGRAEHCIFIWLGGGMAQIDTFDPETARRPRRRGWPARRIASIATAVARRARHRAFAARRGADGPRDRGPHGPSQRHRRARRRHHPRPHRPADQRHRGLSVDRLDRSPTSAAPAEGVPAYVLIGYPNVSRGPGFLGPHGYVYLTDTNAGPAGFTRPADVSPKRQADREICLQQVRRPGQARRGAARTTRRSAKACGWPARSSCALSPGRGSAGVRERYGGEFGQRCLLAGAWSSAACASSRCRTT